MKVNDLIQIDNFYRRFIESIEVGRGCDRFIVIIADKKRAYYTNECKPIRCACCNHLLTKDNSHYNEERIDETIFCLECHKKLVEDGTLPF